MKLLEHIFAAHQECARRPNASTQVIVGAFGTNGHDFARAVAAGLGTLGGKHGPIADAQRFLMSGDAPEVIPGYGSSFVKGEPDPVWKPTEECLREMFPHEWERLWSGHEILKDRGLALYPNAAGYTAAYGMAVGIAPELTPGIFISARMPVWADLCAEVLKGD